MSPKWTQENKVPLCMPHLLCTPLLPVCNIYPCELRCVPSLQSGCLLACLSGESAACTMCGWMVPIIQTNSQRAKKWWPATRSYLPSLAVHAGHRRRTLPQNDDGAPRRRSPCSWRWWRHAFSPPNGSPNGFPRRNGPSPWSRPPRIRCRPAPCSHAPSPHAAPSLPSPPPPLGRGCSPRDDAAATARRSARVCVYKLECEKRGRVVLVPVCFM